MHLQDPWAVGNWHKRWKVFPAALAKHHENSEYSTLHDNILHVHITVTLESAALIAASQISRMEINTKNSLRYWEKFNTNSNSTGQKEHWFWFESWCTLLHEYFYLDKAALSNDWQDQDKEIKKRITNVKSKICESLNKNFMCVCVCV